MGPLPGCETGPVLTDTASTQLVLDLVGVFVFALTGAIVGVRRGLDVFGVLVLGWIAGLGGGIIRDVFLGITPPVAVSDWRLLAAAVVAGLAVFLLHGTWQEVAQRHPDARLGRVSFTVRLLDAAGLAVFAVSGALVALDAQAGALAATLIGGITGIGGGLLRDVLTGQVPEVLRRELYAVPALAGAALVVVLHEAGALTTLTAWAAVAFVFVTRVVAVVLNLNAPRPLRSRA
ncbi:putative membrane protein YeiH [Ornithinibacter aureus]|nr:putative membrane protein YeiH [Ornithinibacter aureus]